MVHVALSEVAYISTVLCPTGPPKYIVRLAVAPVAELFVMFMYLPKSEVPEGTDPTGFVSCSYIEVLLPYKFRSIAVWLKVVFVKLTYWVLEFVTI